MCNTDTLFLCNLMINASWLKHWSSVNSNVGCLYLIKCTVTALTNVDIDVGQRTQR